MFPTWERRTLWGSTRPEPTGIALCVVRFSPFVDFRKIAVPDLNKAGTFYRVGGALSTMLIYHGFDYLSRTFFRPFLPTLAPAMGGTLWRVWGCAVLLCGMVIIYHGLHLLSTGNLQFFKLFQCPVFRSVGVVGVWCGFGVFFLVFYWKRARDTFKRQKSLVIWCEGMPRPRPPLYRWAIYSTLMC